MPVPKLACKVCVPEAFAKTIDPPVEPEVPRFKLPVLVAEIEPVVVMPPEPADTPPVPVTVTPLPVPVTVIDPLDEVMPLLFVGKLPEVPTRKP